MRTATRGTGTIVKRMADSGLAYEITNILQISTFMLNGGKYVAVAHWQDYVNMHARIFIGFYETWQEAADAADSASRRHGCYTTFVVKVMERHGENVR